MATSDRDFTSSAAVKPSVKGLNHENELNSEMATRLKSPNKKQLPTKHFMSPTISAASKANVPKRKILTEINETLDVTEPNSLLRSTPSFSMQNDGVNLKPYDPFKNYLSPRPKFLRYNPNRRKDLSAFKRNEDEDSTKRSICVLSPSKDSIGSIDSCSNKESVDEKSENSDDEVDETEDEFEDEYEDEMVELVGNRCLSLMSVFKFLFVMIAVIVIAQGICSMNLPSESQTLERSLNETYDVYGSASLNFYRVEFHPFKEADLGNDEIVIEEVENENADYLQRAENLQEIAENEEMEIDNIDAENEVYDSEKKDTAYLQQIEVLQELQIAEIDEIKTVNKEAEGEVVEEYDTDTDIDETNAELTADAEYKITEKTKKISLIFGFSGLILTFFSFVYRLKSPKTTTSISTTVAQENNVAEKQKIKILNLAPIQSDESSEPLDSLQNLESKEFSGIHAPSVELLSEFVFGDEVTSSVKSFDISVREENDSSDSFIQPTTVSSIRTKLSQMEMSTGDSRKLKKQKCTKSDFSSGSSMVTPSPVRRSSRIRSRSVTKP